MHMLSLFLFLLSALCIREISLLPDGKLHMHVFDVGQGDSIFLVTPSGKQILVDGGPDLSTLRYLGRYMPLLDRSIDIVVMTHGDLDHRASLPEVLRRYDVSMLLTPQNADPTMDIALGDGTTLDIIWGNTPMKNRNDQSVVFRVLYKNYSILLTGDIEQKAEAAILATGADVRADTLKVAHHGSMTSTSTGFLLAVDPKEAFISAGRDNRFGHPHTEVLDRLERFGIPKETTAESGVISRVFE